MLREASPALSDGSHLSDIAQFLDLGDVAPSPESDTRRVTPSLSSPTVKGRGRAKLIWMRHVSRPHQRRPGVRAVHPSTGESGVFPLHRAALG